MNTIHNAQDYGMFTFLNQYKSFECIQYGQDTLYDIITNQVTQSQIVYASLKCETVIEDINIEYLVIGYLFQCGLDDDYFPDSVLQLLHKMVILNRFIDLRSDLITNNIYDNHTLLLYKDFNHPFIEYNKLNLTQKILIYIQDIDGYTKSMPQHIRSKTLRSETTKVVKKTGRARARSDANSMHQIQITDIEKKELWICVLDTVSDVCQKINDELDIKVRNNLIFGKYKLNDKNRKIIDWGVVNGSCLQLYNPYNNDFTY